MKVGVKKGYKQTPEAIENRRKSMIGHPVTDITREKISKIHKNRVISEKQRKQISETLSGGKLSEYHKKKIQEGVAKFIRGEKSPAKNEKLENLAGRPRPDTCEVCGNWGSICFDHDHDSDKFRGWICTRCNLVLGRVHDEVIILQKLITYLNESNTQ